MNQRVHVLSTEALQFFIAYDPHSAKEPEILNIYSLFDVYGEAQKLNLDAPSL